MTIPYDTMKLLTLFLLLCYKSYTYGNAVNRGFLYNKSLIVGGRYAHIREYPCMGHLRLYGTNNIECGSTILHDRALLTAAHCFYLKPNNIRVTIGTAYPHKHGLNYYTKKYQQHPSFVFGLYDYDIGVVKTRSKMTLDTIVTRAVILADNLTLIAEGHIVEIAGWGLMSFPSLVESPALRSTTVTVVSNEHCQRIHELITKRMFCAHGVNEHGDISDQCNGDSGGPALRKGKQVGIMSGTIECGTTGIPSIYTNVAALNSWIKRAAKMLPNTTDVIPVY